MAPKNKPKENENAFKHSFDLKLLKQISTSVLKYYPAFDASSFHLLSTKLEALEMKPRIHAIRDELKKQLPLKYPEALAVLLKVLRNGKLEGFGVWPIAEYIQAYGLDHPELSLDALKFLTTLFTSEWAVRPFISRHPDQTMKYLLKCAEDENAHVRRWASEGSRPRVPWGERLQAFILDPGPTRKILDKLKFDPELYVRKSVANHLNDITKDHPDYVIQLLKEWKKEAQGSDKTKVDWIIHRSLRTLIKDGNPKALALIDVSHGASVSLEKFTIQQKNLKVGESLEFEVELRSTSKKSQKLVIDYIMHFMKSNRSTGPKVFKLKKCDLSPKDSLKIVKKHSLKQITTREYYSGTQHIEIQVNGKIMGKQTWRLKTAR